MKNIQLNKLSLEDLLKLRDLVAKVLVERVEAEKRDLEARLNRLKSANIVEFPAGEARAAAATRFYEPSWVKVVYANPADPTDVVWSGRGRRPMWLVAELKKGRKLSDFQVPVPPSGDANARNKQRALKGKRR